MKIIAIACVAVTAASGAARLEEADTRLEKTLLAHRVGRVAINLPENGSLGRCVFDDTGMGLRWPCETGMEFLGNGGIVLRFRIDGKEGWNMVNPRMFVAERTDGRANIFVEGCEGGRRYPGAGCDDDNDGAIDEDPFDMIDNDGDGAVDEDFGVIGHEMAVTRGTEQGTGLTLTQESYVWSYGHVRDFAGFTTTILYPEGEGDRKPDLIDLDVAHYIDFMIGPKDDRNRGRGNKWFFIREKEVGDSGTRGQLPAVFASVSDENWTGLGAVVIFGVKVPGNPGTSFDTHIIDSYECPDSLWNGLPGGTNEREPVFRQINERYEVSEPEKGRKTIVNRLKTALRLEPGDMIKIEWGLVFGRSRKTLVRNISMALETYGGIEDDYGKAIHWIVPARKALLVETGACLVPVWVRGKRKPAVSIMLPSGIDEDIEWLKVDGHQSGAFERVGGRLVVSIDDELVAEGKSFRIEGQLSDGTIFTAGIDQEAITAFAGGEAVAPGRLPDEALNIFPNPFVESLNININIREAPELLEQQESREILGTSSVRIYDVKGRLVRIVLHEDFLHPGDYSIGWDGRDEKGVKVSPGVYYCKLQIGERNLTKRVILLR